MVMDGNGGYLNPQNDFPIRNGFPRQGFHKSPARTWVDVWMDRKHDGWILMWMVEGSGNSKRISTDGCFLSFVRSDLNSLYFSI